METKDNSNYALANISNDDLLIISEIEKKLSKKTNQDIVLIAYQPSSIAEA